MNKPEAHESFGQPQRVAHTDEIQNVNLVHVCGLLYVVVSWVVGQALILWALWGNSRGYFCE